jgi:hypothetical protein
MTFQEASNIPKKMQLKEAKNGGRNKTSVTMRE